MMLISYSHQAIPLAPGYYYLFILIKCIMTANKVFYSASVFVIVLDKENVAKHCKELYLWRLVYDLVVIAIDVFMFV
jgi:hypothetical protein